MTAVALTRFTFLLLVNTITKVRRPTYAVPKGRNSENKRERKPARLWFARLEPLVPSVPRPVSSRTAPELQSNRHQFEPSRNRTLGTSDRGEGSIRPHTCSSPAAILTGTAKPLKSRLLGGSRWQADGKSKAGADTEWMSSVAAQLGSFMPLQK